MRIRTVVVAVVLIVPMVLWIAVREFASGPDQVSERAVAPASPSTEALESTGDPLHTPSKLPELRDPPPRIDPDVDSDAASGPDPVPAPNNTDSSGGTSEPLTWRDFPIPEPHYPDPNQPVINVDELVTSAQGPAPITNPILDPDLGSDEPPPVEDDPPATGGDTPPADPEG